MRAIAAVTLVLVVILSAANGAARPRTIVGVVDAIERGKYMSVSNEMTGASSMPLTLRESTSYDDSGTAITPGTRVQVWYRTVGERRAVADRVRIIPDGPRR